MSAAQDSNSQREGGVMGRSYQPSLKVGWQERHFPDRAGRTSEEDKMVSSICRDDKEWPAEAGDWPFGRVGVKDEV